MANTIGFSVAINVAKDILPQLKSSGKVRRGWLGVAIQPLTSDLQESFKLSDRNGALVARVDPKSPAAEAGLQRGDVIVEFDGRPVKEMAELPRIVGTTPIGKTCEVVVMREGKRKTFQVKVSELAETAAASPGGPRDKGGPTAWGMRVGNVTPDVARQLELEDPRGAVVMQIEPGSAADEAELRRGDVILEVNGQAIANVEALHSALEGADKGVRLLVRRGKSEIYVALKKKKAE
jgi:serine protease Do